MSLELQNVSGGYGRKVVLEQISFCLEKGKIFSILGTNGCGKSTLLKIAGRVRPLLSGSVLLDRQDIRRFTPKELAKKVAILPQTAEIPDGISVEELVALGRYPYRESATQTKEHVYAALEAMEITDTGKRIASTLSGGERQRVRLAMTLAQDPEYLLLDEPTTFLDIRCQFEILELIRKLNRERKITVLMILHDLSLASLYSDRLLFLKEKRIYYSGTPEEVMKPEIIRDVFGIESQIIRSGNNLFCLPSGKKSE